MPKIQRKAEPVVELKTATEDKNQARLQAISADFSKDVETDDLGWDLPVEEVKDETPHYMFVADCSMTTNIRDQLNSYSNIRAYDKDLFTNRSPSQLLNDHKVEHIWLHIDSTSGKVWLKKWIKYISPFQLIVVYSKTKHAKYISQLKPYADHVVKSSELKKIKSLSMKDLSLSLDCDLSLSSSPNLLAMCLGLSKAVNKISDSQKNA